MRTRVVVLVLLVLGAIVASPAPAPAGHGASAVRGGAYGDFNGDGEADLAVGVPGENIGSTADAGGVNVLYGVSGSGLGASGDQFFSQDTTGLAGAAEEDDAFGSALASGDFNGDGNDDLAVGVPDEALSGTAGAGGVNVIYGSASGLTVTSDQFWSQNSTGIAGAAESGDAFGLSLASGDFDNDGFADLVIGVPEENLDGEVDAGAVNVLYGSASGLASAGDALFSQATADVESDPAEAEEFGTSVAAGDFDGDTFDDLAVGVPGEEASNEESAGGVNVLYGATTTGLGAAGDQFWTQDSTGVSGAPEVDDGFGFAVAAGDFDNDTFDDLAVGVVGEAIGGHSSAGAVNVLYGATGTGLTATGDQMWYQDVSGVSGASETEDLFGFSLAGGDFDGDNFEDLAIGAPGEAIGSATSAGAVNVLYGATGTGLSAAGDQLWHQDISGVAGSAEPEDVFGASVVAGDFDGDTFDDLAATAPGEAIDSVAAAGGVNVLYGVTGTGLGAAGDQFWSQNSTGVAGASESSDNFGGAIT